jgi:hypothetical protein
MSSCVLLLSRYNSTLLVMTLHYAFSRLASLCESTSSSALRLTPALVVESVDPSRSCDTAVVKRSAACKMAAEGFTSVSSVTNLVGIAGLGLPAGVPPLIDLGEFLTAKLLPGCGVFPRLRAGLFARSPRFLPSAFAMTRLATAVATASDLHVACDI